MKTVKRLISVLLVLILLAGYSVNGFADSESTYKYLAIGDSTSTGHYSDEYTYGGMYDLNCGENPNIYPSLMGEYLSETVSRNVEVECILPEGIRATDLRAILDPSFTADEYYKTHIKQWSGRFAKDYADLHEKVSNAISNADLISIDICMSALGNYLNGRIQCALGLNSEKDYEKYYGSDILAAYCGGKFASVVNSVSSLRGEAREYLEKLGINASVIPRIIEALEYSVGTTMINFSECVKLIYKLNEDVQLIVISPFVTTCYDLTLSVGGISFSLGALIHMYVSTVYDYIVNIDRNRGNYKLADMYHTYLRCYTDAIADGECEKYSFVTQEIRNILLSHGVPVDENIPEQEQYFRETVCKNVEKALADTEFDLSFEALDIIKGYLSGDKSIENALVSACSEDYDSAPQTARLVLRLIFVFELWGCHPDYSGHLQKYEAIRKAYDSDFTAKYNKLLYGLSTLKRMGEAVKSGQGLIIYLKSLIKTCKLSIFLPKASI